MHTRNGDEEAKQATRRLITGQEVKIEGKKKINTAVYSKTCMQPPCAIASGPRGPRLVMRIYMRSDWEKLLLIVLHQEISGMYDRLILFSKLSFLNIHHCIISPNLSLYLANHTFSLGEISTKFQTSKD